MTFIIHDYKISHELYGWIVEYKVINKKNPAKYRWRRSDFFRTLEQSVKYVFDQRFKDASESTEIVLTRKESREQIDRVIKQLNEIYSEIREVADEMSKL